MVQKTTKSELAGKLDMALANHANDETTERPEMNELPPGITGGIAQLAVATLGTFQSGPNQGKPFVRLAGVIRSPETVTYAKKFWDPKTKKAVSGEPVTVRVKGRQTSKMFPLCDTKRTIDGQEGVMTIDEHVAEMLNELRVLGGPDFTEGVTSASLPGLLDALVEAGPRFRFSTSSRAPNAQYPDERTWENWHGTSGLEAEPAAEPEPMADATGEPSEPEAGQPEANQTPEAEPASDVESPGPLTDLAEAADGGDETAQAALTERAQAVGVDPNAFGSWEEVAKAVADLEDTKGGEAEPPAVPVKGQTWGYKAPGAKRVADCEVVAVMEGKQTANVKRFSDKKLFKAVPWSELVPVG